MTKRSIKKYTNEFKEGAIKLALSASSVNEAAQSLGMPTATLHQWVQAAKKSGRQSIQMPDGNINHVNVHAVLEENQELKKRLRRLEQEKDLLKKAATYFAQELD
jgi:transposase